MTRVPSVDGRRLLKALGKYGFDVIRIKGSHHFLRHPDGRSTVVPIHSNETIGKGLLFKILKDCELTVEKLSIFRLEQNRRFRSYFYADFRPITNAGTPTCFEANI